MSDPTTPREVIARLLRRDYLDEHKESDFILGSLAASGYEIVKKEPDAIEVTAAMVEAGAMALSGYSSVEWPLIHEDERALERDRTQTILTAALKARG